MNHQGVLEKRKYRNWVGGGLAYKYLKEGIEGFADDVVQQEHSRILSVVSQTHGLTCNQCCLGNLRPLHKCERDPVTGRNKCPWHLSNCNCLYPKKHTCPNQVCDRIMEDILKGHGSQPPTPNWKNTYMQKWCSAPWEIAKCFINAPGYSDKTKAADIDTPGLLHVFINNINLQSHLSDKINRNGIFKKTLQRRNELFHSPTMEMEDTELYECIDEIIEILEDEKELKVRYDAQQAVLKLKQLKQESFIITTHNEVEVCRDALASITIKSEELKQTIQDAKDDIGMKQTEAKEAIDDKANECRDAIVSITKQSAAELKQTIQDTKDDISKKQTEAIEATGGNVKECRDAVTSITNKSLDLKQTIQKAKADFGKKQAEATEAIKDKTQKALQQINKHSEILYERVRRLEIDSSFSKQRPTVLESKEDEMDIIRQNHQREVEYVEEKHALQKKLVELYQNYYLNTSISPLELEENNINIKEVYVAPEMVVEGKPDRRAANSSKNSPNKPNIRTLSGYREILQTNGQKHKQIYIVGDVGTGKSTFSKMMIQNWCSAVTADNANDKSKDTCRSIVEAVNDENINEMKNYDFLFFVPLQRMSGLGEISKMVKAMVTGSDLASNDLVDRIFEQESERCLIIADGLDEWTPPKNKYKLPHVSYGLPIRDRGKHATVVTLSRPSAKGILNLKFTECDQKVELLGIHSTAVEFFIENYLSKYYKICLSSRAFRQKIEMAKLEHLEKSPLLLQQLVWLYCTGNEIGKSISDTYSHFINIMLEWSRSKEDGDDIDEDQICDTKEDKDMNLPRLLRRFPRCEENKGLLLPLARVAFEALTSETGSTTFGRLHLRQKGVPKGAIAALIKFGILVENNCFYPSLENTQLEFIHISYLEFLAAVYVSSHFDERTRSVLPNTVLLDLFQKCKSAADVLQLSNVLKMICGLSPFLISEISKLVSDIISEDESMISYRNSLEEYRYRYRSGYGYRYDHVSDQIQSLILNCLSECDSDDQPMVSLCDVIIHGYTEMSFLQRIIPENVISLQAEEISHVDLCRWIAKLTRLQYMCIGTTVFPHNEMVMVFSLIEEAPLKYLILDEVKCNHYNCHGHKLDLSRHDQFQVLGLMDCHRVKVTNINTKHLEIVRLEDSSISNIDCLLNVRSLKELYITRVLRGYGGYTKRVNSVVHTLQKLRKLRLHNVNIADSALTVTPELRNLEHIELEKVSMNLKTWCTFVDSLLTLQQSVQVDTWKGEDERNYVRRNTIGFELVKDDLGNFSFRTKK